MTSIFVDANGSCDGRQANDVKMSVYVCLAGPVVRDRWSDVNMVNRGHVGQGIYHSEPLVLTAGV